MRRILFLCLIGGLFLSCDTVVVAQESLRAEKQATSNNNSTPSIKLHENAVLKIVEERDIPARISGIIQSSSLREGDLVKLDQLLMQIDNAQAQLELKKAAKEVQMATLEAESRVDLEFVRSSGEVAQAELSRAIRSNQRRPGVVAQSEMDQLALVVKKSIAEEQKTEFQMQMRSMSRDVQQVELELGKLQNEQHQIKAPLAGMIVEIFKRQGEWVEASQPVARVVRLDKLRTEVNLPAEQALHQLLGCNALFFPNLKVDGVQEQYAGKVVFIFPQANPINSEVRVWIEIENLDMKLIPGLTGRLEIETTKP